MRRAAENRIWSGLKRTYANQPTRPFQVGTGSAIDLSHPCIVIGGRNGAGKSRLLRQISDELGDDALLLDLHHLCEQALIILRSRHDLDAMVEEYDDLGPNAERFDDLKRVVGREYTAIEWYALEIEPSDQEIAQRFHWSGDQPLVPYFRVEYRGLRYSSRDMGLGEFSVHFLFWILEQYRDVPNLTLLLDEPDAFLPPVGVSALLARVLQICVNHGWKVVLTTHSEEMISEAVEQRAFTLLRVDESGATVAEHAVNDPNVADALLTRPPVEHVIFCEDESAWYLTNALIDYSDRQLLRGTAVVWGTGSGYLNRLYEHLPRPPRADIRFAIAFDGDQRGSFNGRDGRWPAAFLPTDDDPDTLFKTLAADSATLASKLGRSKEDVARRLDAIEGLDPHDWVNDLGAEFGRVQVLGALAAMWVEMNPYEASRFVDGLKAGWS
ncbi:ATP-dependent nuclease [Paractinoplanes lichenicola]|uniref:ATP-binding protein n=1 Tax=Paractinoplanes lichenicola TaxID=2802976 RepID=A0ABS1VR94_9ACTN|nr:ATP-binding protein [Actinoplanes lichenicola]MBL7257237.1 ATP-binding protein [Actinoplanes lichenicola]